MQIRRFTGALVLAAMTAVGLHLSAQPANADTLSVCAQLQAIILSIEASTAPDDAKVIAIAAVSSAKRFAGCTE